MKVKLGHIGHSVLSMAPSWASDSVKSISSNFEKLHLYQRAKMAQYHNLWKFLAKKHCFGNKWQSTTFSRTRVSKTQIGRAHV